MAEEALLDAAVETEVSEETQETSDSVGSDSGGGSDAALETSSETPELKGSTLWRDLKGPLYSGKALTRDQIKAVRNAIQSESAISSKYPNGLSEVETVLEAAKSLADDESIPLPEAIQQTLQERSYFRELNGLYTKGDPKFVERLVEAGPEAFENIAPAVLRKYAEINPEAYSAQVAQAVVRHMQGAEVPLQFRILSTFLPQLPDGPAKDQVIQACEALFGWSEGLKALSQKKIEAKAIPTQENQAKGQDPQAQQIDLTRREWNLSVRDEGTNMVYSAAQKEVAALKKTALSDVEKKKVLSKVGEELDARLLMDKNYGTSMQGYLKAGNRASYIQTLQSKRKAFVPAAVKRAVSDVLAERPAKVAAQNGKQPGNGKQAQSALKPNQGATQFRKISGPPKTQNLMVDLNRTPQSMLVKRQAYIKGEERPVSWAT